VEAKWPHVSRPFQVKGRVRKFGACAVLLFAGRRASGPLSSIPSNVMDEDLPMLNSAMTGDTSKQTAGTAKEAAAAAGGRKSGRRAAAAAGGGGGGGGPEDSDHDMTDADGAHGEDCSQLCCVRGQGAWAGLAGAAVAQQPAGSSRILAQQVPRLTASSLDGFKNSLGD
jgi:hypothetical protein